MHFEHALQAVGDLDAGAADTPRPTDEAVRGAECAKWRLRHGCWLGCRRKLAALCRLTQREHIRNVGGIGRVERHVMELFCHLERNEGSLLH